MTILLPDDPKIVDCIYILAHSGSAIRCCPIADSHLILEFLFLHIRGGCSLTVLIFFLMLVGTCCFILSASLCKPHGASQHSNKI